MSASVKLPVFLERLISGLYDEENLPGLVLLVLAILLGLFLFISRYNHPLADDFSYACECLKYPYWQAQAIIYQGWNGRYTATALLTLYPRIFDIFVMVKWLPILIMGVLWYSIALFFHSTPCANLDQKRCFQLALLILTFYLATAPDLSESFYWLSAAITYTVGSSFVLLALSFMHKANAASETKKAFFLSVGACLLAFLAVGCNELAMMLLFLMSAWQVIHSLSRNRWRMNPASIRWSILFLVVCLASAIMVFAPGNAVRSHSFPHSHQWLFSLQHSLLDVGNMFLRGFSNIALLSVSCLLWPIIRKRIPEKGNAPVTAWTALGYAGIWFLLVMGILFAVYWCLGISLPHRVRDVAWFVFLMGWMLQLFLWASVKIPMPEFIMRKSPFSGRIGSLWKSGILTLVFVIGLLHSSNPRHLFYDLTSRAVSYDQALRDRYECIARAKKKGGKLSLIVPPLKTTAKTLFFADISTDPSDYKNLAFAEFMGLDKIRTFGFQSGKLSGKLLP